MSFLSKLKSGHLSSPRGGSSPHRGVTAVGFAVDKGERYGAALAYGFLKGYYHEQFTFKGYGYDLLSGAALVLGSAFLNIRSHGSSKVACHLERIGDAGISSYLNSIGTSWGSTKAGRLTQVSEAGAAKGALAAGGKKRTVAGWLPPAMGGAVLSVAEIQNFAKKR